MLSTLATLANLSDFKQGWNDTCKNHINIKWNISIEVCRNDGSHTLLHISETSLVPTSLFLLLILLLLSSHPKSLSLLLPSSHLLFFPFFVSSFSFLSPSSTLFSYFFPSYSFFSSSFCFLLFWFSLLWSPLLLTLLWTSCYLYFSSSPINFRIVACKL